MLKIGLVNIDTSHPLEFAEIMCDGMGMRYDMVYNDGFRKDDEVNWFVDKYCGGKRAKTIDELAEKMDIGFIQSCNWEKHIDQSLPFIRRGKPVFIDKPIIGSVADAERIMTLVKSGAVILGSSSARYAKEVEEFLSIPEEERGEVINVYGTCGVDEFNYGIHIAEIISEIACSKPTGCRFLGYGKKEGVKTETYQAHFENGVTGIYTIQIGRWQPFCITIMTTKSSYTFKIDSSMIYKALLDRIYDYMSNGKDVLAKVETIVDCTKLMLCGQKSKNKMDGAYTDIQELDSSDLFDGYQFEMSYGEAAGVNYKDEEK